MTGKEKNGPPDSRPSKLHPIRTCYLAQFLDLTYQHQVSKPRHNQKKEATKHCETSGRSEQGEER
jgi:hypothetical protein